MARKIVLFGSLLDGDVNKKSDIDLLLIFENSQNPETGIELKMATKLGLAVLDNYQIENNFSFVVIDTKNPSTTDKEFLTATASQGVVIWQRGGFNFLTKHKEMQSWVIFDYSTKNLSPANKRKLLRSISKLAQHYGKKLGKGVIMVDKKQAKVTEEMLQECKVSYKKQEIFS